MQVTSASVHKAWPGCACLLVRLRYALFELAVHGCSRQVTAVKHINKLNLHGETEGPERSIYNSLLG